MPADTDIEAFGTVTEVLPGSKFRVTLTNKNVVFAHLSGRMRTHSIKIVLGDKVKLAMSPYDLSKARITRRED